MMGKTVFIFQLLLIIIFLNFSLCIRNEGNIYNSEGRNRQNIIRFSAEDALIPITDPTAGNVQQAQPNKAQDKFTFSSQRYQYSVNNPQDTTKNFGRRKYVDPSITSRQRGTPPNALFNTGEHYQSSSNYYNRRPSSNYHRPYGGQYESNAVDTDNVVTNYQSYGDNPNYFQDNYAHNYNYPGNKRPNYNLRATPPPRPPPVPSQSPYPYDYPYQPQYDQSGRPPPPYPYPHPESIQQQSPYDYPSYASLFNNFQAFSNPLTSLFSGFTGGGRPSNPLGSQITKALENISANDDLNCVPKLLCQMIGNPERRAELPGFLTAPAITSLIAALPVASPALVYGRAALLGFTGGEESCESTYNKCPSNEDDLLYYLNNHRGGFFRFFNGGESFSEVSSNFQDPQSQYTGSRPQSQYTGSRPQSTYSGSNQGALQSLSDSASPAGGGFNLLGSLASFFLPGFQSTSSGSDGYETTTRRPIYNDDYYGNNHLNRYPSSSSSRPSGGEGYIYVTNSKGVVDHYIKPNGQKVYV
ncbi:uncharacterized protein LOC119650370 isoform X2 [Hermetia illucens]|uniref:uncharacterized protein LOC119650370 isoform X2 n=1 Tax=Hermetia illucens TaxID=343691 RepID=UPI0018CC01CD|nr:uncharacterized protein LOC119650370 isoform X2 [Hermetia illucens]